MKKLMLLALLVLPLTGYAEGTRGGGNFSIPLFWEKVEKNIIPELKSLKENGSKYLSKKDIDKLIGLMNKKKTKVVETNEVLTIKVKGKKVPVDALNYPGRNFIELYKPTWNSRTQAEYSIDYLILHEFMGLAGLTDIDSEISVKVFPPSREPLDFSSDTIICNGKANYIKFDDQNWHIRSPNRKYIEIKLSDGESINKNPKCGLEDTSTGECIKYVGDYKVKKAKGRIELDFDKDTKADKDYFIEVSANLRSSYYNFGYGGARNRLFNNDPQLYVSFKLKYFDKEKGRNVTAANIIDSSDLRLNSLSKQHDVAGDIPVPVFEDALESNGFELGLAPYNGEMAGLYSNYNIAGYLQSIAEGSGAANVDKYVVETVFNGYSVQKDAKYSALPYLAFATCSLKKAKQN